MLIDNYINYLRESYEIYNEAEYRFPDKLEIYKQVRATNGHGTLKDVKSVFDTDAAYRGQRFVSKNRMQDVQKKLNNKIISDKKNANIKKNNNIKKGLAAAAAVTTGGAVVYGAKKLRDHVKAKRSEKAKEVAVEEGISLEEAYGFILECEMDLINEGYELYEIYED